MTLDEALESARILADSQQVRLGSRRYAVPCGPTSEVWIFSFDIEGGPPDWHWFIYLGKTGLTSQIWAVDHRPQPRLAGNGLKLPDDDWHNYLWLWLDTSETACTQCGLAPELLWAWENKDSRPGEVGAVGFAIRAAAHLKQLGWQMLDGFLWCPECAAKHVPAISD